MRMVPLFVVGILLAATGCATVSAEETASSAETTPDTSCVIPHDWDADDAWIRNPAAQLANLEFARLVDSHFGSNNKGHPFNQLSHGLIGGALDHRAQEAVVVVDPRLVDIASLNAKFRNLAEKTPTELTYRAQAGCFPVEQLIEAGKVIRARDWHPAASTTGYSGWLDPHTSTHHYTFSPNDRAVGEALKERLGDLVTIDYGQPMTKLPKK